MSCLGPRRCRATKRKTIVLVPCDELLSSTVPSLPYTLTVLRVRVHARAIFESLSSAAQWAPLIPMSIGGSDNIFNYTLMPVRMHMHMHTHTHTHTHMHMHMHRSAGRSSLSLPSSSNLTPRSSACT